MHLSGWKRRMEIRSDRDSGIVAEDNIIQNPGALAKTIAPGFVISTFIQNLRICARISSKRRWISARSSTAVVAPSCSMQSEAAALA